MKNNKGLNAPFIIQSGYLLLILIIVLCMKLLGINCLFRLIFHIPCPTCGMTRALFALLSGDFLGYVHFNFMALPVSISLLVIIYKKYLAKVFEIIGYVFLILNFVYYIYRLIKCIIP